MTTTTTQRIINVRRNARSQIKRIVDGAADVKRYNLPNEFRGEPVPTRQLEGIVKRHFVDGHRTRLTHDTQGTFTLHVHSNLWYEFRSVALPATSRESRPRQTEQEKAVALHERLGELDFDAVPVVTGERLGRKERAQAARQLFKRLGLKGISVRTPNYSMAHAVDVTLPKRTDYEHDADGIIDTRCEASTENSKAAAIVRELLDHAFPGCVDRSDLRTDYFDFCWSVE